MIDVFKALADENRLRIINLLINAELCVCELELLLAMSQSNASRHLNKLKTARLITSSKETQWVHYKFSEDFQKEHELLAQYLEKRFRSTAVFVQDLKRCQIYKDSRYDCQDIRNDKDTVKNYLAEQMNI